jgi:hypothetical protein
MLGSTVWDGKGFSIHSCIFELRRVMSCTEDDGRAVYWKAVRTVRRGLRAHPPELLYCRWERLLGP